MQSALGQLAQRAQQQQIDLLNADMQGTQSGVPKLLGDFWASGLDEAAVERDGANPIAPLLTRIDAIRRSKDVPAAIAALHQVGIPLAFNFSADVDLQDLYRHIGYFSQGGLGLPDPAYYTRTDADTRALLGRYTDYVFEVLALTGSKPAHLKADTQAVLGYRKRIAQASRPLVDDGRPASNYTGCDERAGQAVQTSATRRFPQGPGRQRRHRVDGQSATVRATRHAGGGLKPDQWKTYLRYQIGAAMRPTCRKHGATSITPSAARSCAANALPSRQQQVLDAINVAAGPMVGREYVACYLPETMKSRATEIATQVRDALGRGSTATPG